MLSKGAIFVRRRKAAIMGLFWLLAIPLALTFSIRQVATAHSFDFKTNGCTGGNHDSLCHGTGGGGYPPAVESCNFDLNLTRPSGQPSSGGFQTDPATFASLSSIVSSSNVPSDPNPVASDQNGRLRVYLRYEGAGISSLSSSWQKAPDSSFANYFLNANASTGEAVQLRVSWGTITSEEWPIFYHLLNPNPWSRGWSSAGPFPAGEYRVIAEMIPASSGNNTNCRKTIMVNVVNPSSPEPPTPQPTTGKLPYFKVYSGDTAAGVGFGSSCNPKASNGGSNPGIRTFTNSSNQGGAGTGVIAMASGVIDKFLSAQRNGSPSPPKGLTLGNSSGAFGGSLGTTSCVPDYYQLASALPGAITIPTASARLQDDLATNPNPGQYMIHRYTQGASDRPLTIRLASNQRITGKHLVYVDGDVVIDSNIRYQDGAWNLSSKPSLWVIVKGNLYIKPGVTSVEGVLVAQPTDGSKGVTFTCTNAEGTGAPSTAAEWTACGGSGSSASTGGSATGECEIVEGWGPQFGAQYAVTLYNSSGQPHTKGACQSLVLYDPWWTPPTCLPWNPPEYCNPTGSVATIAVTGRLTGPNGYNTPINGTIHVPPNRTNWTHPLSPPGGNVVPENMSNLSPGIYNFQINESTMFDLRLRVL